MPQRPSLRPLRQRLLLAAGAVALAACYGAPGPSAESTSALVGEMTRRGAVVLAQTSGDAGCTDASLAPNAIHLRMTVPADAIPRDVYLFRFKPTAYESGAAVVDACQLAFTARSSRAGGPVERLDNPPFRAFGDGWSPALTELLSEALTAGGVPAPSRSPGASAGG